MGCDIHAMWQAQIDGAWTDIESEYNQDRNYRLFAVLANVRNYGGGFENILHSMDVVHPISLPRGYPEDFEVSDEGDHPISDMKHLDKWEQENNEGDHRTYKWMGDHSHSWLLGSEMLTWWEVSAPSEPTIERCAHFFDEVRRLVELHGEIRFVFGFDS